jgi:hypothetical protein
LSQRMHSKGEKMPQWMEKAGLTWTRVVSPKPARAQDLEGY